ncbi:unnamed protein product, partial [Tilletia caries]
MDRENRGQGCCDSRDSSNPALGSAHSTPTLSSALPPPSQRCLHRHRLPSSSRSIGAYRHISRLMGHGLPSLPSAVYRASQTANTNVSYVLLPLRVRSLGLSGQRTAQARMQDCHISSTVSDSALLSFGPHQLGQRHPINGNAPEGLSFWGQTTPTTHPHHTSSQSTPTTDHHPPPARHCSSPQPLSAPTQPTHPTMPHYGRQRPTTSRYIPPAPTSIASTPITAHQRPPCSTTPHPRRLEPTSTARPHSVPSRPTKTSSRPTRPTSASSVL